MSLSDGRYEVLSENEGVAEDDFYGSTLVCTNFSGTLMDLSISCALSKSSRSITIFVSAFWWDKTTSGGAVGLLRCTASLGSNVTLDSFSKIYSFLSL